MIVAAETQLKDMTRDFEKVKTAVATFVQQSNRGAELRRSKTDQLGISFPIHIFRLNSYPSPYEPLTKYLSARYDAHATPQHPLFLTETGKMATRFWFQKHFHYVLPILGICSEHYSSHSFRIGAASTAARLGISDQTVQVLGRWSSQAYHTYIRNNLNDLRQ
ncbi:hypothetical protein JOQ06_023672, partial [Pogonophryne albipinna]